MNGCSRGSPPSPRGRPRTRGTRGCARRRRRWTCRGGGVARRAPERARRADPRGAWGETPRVCARKERRRGVRWDASVGRIVARVGSSGHPRGIPSLSGKGEGAIGAHPWMGTRHASRRTKAPRSAQSAHATATATPPRECAGVDDARADAFPGSWPPRVRFPRPADESPAGAGSRMAPPARRARRVGIDARADARARNSARGGTHPPVDSSSCYRQTTSPAVRERALNR